MPSWELPRELPRDEDRERPVEGADNGAGAGVGREAEREGSREPRACLDGSEPSVGWCPSSGSASSGWSSRRGSPLKSGGSRSELVREPDSASIYDVISQIGQKRKRVSWF